MKYELVIEKVVTKFTKRQDKPTRIRIRNAILELQENPYNTSNITKMSGYDNVFRKRIGDIRIIYEIQDDKLIVHVMDIGSRGDIYNKW